MDNLQKKKLMYVSVKAQLQVVDEIIETLQNRKELLKLKGEELAKEIKGKGNKSEVE